MPILSTIINASSAYFPRECNLSNPTEDASTHKRAKHIKLHNQIATKKKCSMVETICANCFMRTNFISLRKNKTHQNTPSKFYTTNW